MSELQKQKKKWKMKNKIVENEPYIFKCGLEDYVKSKSCDGR